MRLFNVAPQTHLSIYPSCDAPPVTVLSMMATNLCSSIGAFVAPSHGEGPFRIACIATGRGTCTGAALSKDESTGAAPSASFSFVLVDRSEMPRRAQHCRWHSAAPPRPAMLKIPTCSARFGAAARVVGLAARARWGQRKLAPWRRSKSAKFVPLRRCASVAADFCTILTAQAGAPYTASIGTIDKNIPEITRVPPKPSARDYQSPPTK